MTENISKKWNKSAYVNMEYPIPVEMLRNKQYITVTFKSAEYNIAGKVAAVRLLKAKNTIKQ